jgi:transglutaminase-like putative cysteine protease
VAVALEKYVRAYIVSSDYTQAFATAAQVAESRKGDCTEHAVLLAALIRARGIPARVAVGLVYTEQTGQPAFGFHMWNEVYVNDGWIPLDATLARGGIGAAHLKLADTNLASASALTSFLPVAQVAGRLKMKIEAVE